MVILETLRKAGMVHYKTLGGGEHILLDTATGNYELWFANKNHASYGLIYKNTHLEFARTATKEDLMLTSIV